MATYLGFGYLWHTEGAAADPIRSDLLNAIPDSLLRFTSLPDFEAQPLEAFLTPEGWINYGWYQGKFADRGRQVFAKQGLEFVRRVRNELPWDRYAEWRSEELLQWLENIDPGFLAWAKSLEDASARNPASAPAYPADLDAPKLARLVDEHLAAARAAVQRLVTVEGPRTAANTLLPYDDARNRELLAEGLIAIAVYVHPDSTVRAEGLQAQARLSQLRSEISSDARVMHAFAALDTATLTAEGRLLRSRVLRDFRRTGAHLDDVTRNRLRASREAMDRLGTVFVRNLTDDTTTVLATPEELAGLPPDWIARHRRDAAGRVILTTNYPDFFPVIRYGANRALRHRMVIAFFSRGWPANGVVLDSLLHLRQETSRLLGYPNWAAYQAEVRMAGSVDSIRTFLDHLRHAAEPASVQLVERYRSRLRQDDPSIHALSLGDLGYAAELIRRDEFAVDDREVRSYLPFAQVKEGLLDIASQAFGLEFRRVTVPVWHPSVEAYEAHEDGRLIGRFYLDLHPRPGKYTHAAVMPLRPGMAGRQLPEALLVANFAGGEPGDPGLMELADSPSAVTAFLHEFGHLLHAMFAAAPYATMAWPDEHDFVEAPSQLLEALAWSPAVLRRITRHVETDAPLPDDLVLRMRQARALDRPIEVARMIATSVISLSLHDRPAEQVNADSITAAVIETHTGITYPREAHLATAIEHFGMNDYSATFYTYLWSQVIAEDLWSAFDPANPLDPALVRRYRDAILRPGGSRPAAHLIEDFLGRPFGFASWQQWVEGRR
jgi:thimet oligopeptidase